MLLSPGYHRLDMTQFIREARRTDEDLLANQKRAARRWRLRSKTASVCGAAASVASFDHLVGGGEQRRRHVKAERLRSLEADDALDLRRHGHESAHQ